MTRKHRRNLRSKWRSLYVWHRYLGLTAAIFMLLISVTGLLLNHTEQFNLDRRYITSETLLGMYNIKTSHITGFNTGKHWISLIDGNLFFDTQKINESVNALIGAVQSRDIVALASNTAIHLLTYEGELIEILTADSGIPQPVTRIGMAKNSIIIASDNGLLQLNDDLTNTTSVPDKLTVTWSSPTTIPVNIRKPIVKEVFASALPVERVLLDMHSGRLFGGSIGVYAFDLIALIFIFLSVSGGTIWLKQLVKSRQHRKKHL